MLFNSFAFLIFFPTVTTLYFLLPFKFRWALLLAASCYFYMYFIPVYFLVLLFTIIVDYCAGLWIEDAPQHQRRLLLGLSIAANVGVLAIFKYFNFVNDNVSFVSHSIGWHYPIGSLRWALPIGLSFHTFQAMSYTIAVYEGKQKAERHFGIYALYVMFYPQLVAGPIERPQNMLHQFHEPKRFDSARVADGLKRMLWGFFKKIVIADRLASYVQLVYTNPAAYNAPALILATYMFSIQIYCDFSGYSDIALGSAQVMGFRLMENFRQPYFSHSIREFWQRWHISLSTWFRDYVYIPLGGRYGGRVVLYRNIFLTFVISGLWHGAAWTFVIWGALHGFYLIASAMTEPIRSAIVRWSRLARFPRLLGAVQLVVTFHLVTFGWIFFRAASLSDALLIVRHISGYLAAVTKLPARLPSVSIISSRDLLFVGFMVLLLTLYDFALSTDSRVLKRSAFVSIACSLQFWMILAFGMFNNRQFIYFQF
jgi:alginate O-acetyltransferase complex protein AlgI